MVAKKILITGASGFIGSFLVEQALKHNYDTWAGIRSSSNKTYLRDPRIQFIDLDFGDLDRLTMQLKDFSILYGKFDYIIHNAGVTKCIDPSDFDKINFHYTVNFIDALKEAGLVPQKFILMSSLSAFGMWDEDQYKPIQLSDSANPNTLYGMSKLKAEKYLQKQTDFPSIIFRPTGVYGPREKDYFLMIKTINLGFNVNAGFRKQYLSFIYVKDLVDLVFVALPSRVKNKAYFVADGDIYTSKEYTKLVQKIISKKYVLNLTIPLFLLRIISNFSELISRFTHKPSTLNRDKFKIMKQRNWSCDISPLVEDFNFSPNYNLEKGLTETVRWYKDNDWF